MLTNTELLLVQLNNKMDRLIELLESRGRFPAECPDFDPYLINLSCRAPLIKHSSSKCGATGMDDTNEKGKEKMPIHYPAMSAEDTCKAFLKLVDDAIKTNQERIKFLQGIGSTNSVVGIEGEIHAYKRCKKVMNDYLTGFSVPD